MELINFDNEEGGKLDFAEQLQQDWLNACLAADIPAVTRDTAARLLAVLYVHGGGHEEMVMNRKFTNEMRYIQRRYGIEGGMKPDAQVVNLIQHYVTELMEQREQSQTRLNSAESRQKSSKAQLEQHHAATHPHKEETTVPGASASGTTADSSRPTVSPSGTAAPEWAVKLFRDRYGINLKN